MYMRVTRTRFDPAQLDEAAADQNAQAVLAAARRQPGFRGGYVARDWARGQGVAVSLWDTAEQAGLDRAALGDVVARAQALGIQAEPPEIYEVVAEA